METELLAIVDNGGGRVQNILIEHPVYGEIQILTFEADSVAVMSNIFFNRSKGSLNSVLYLSWQDGVHYHLIQADSTGFDYVETALRDLGFLLE